MTPEPSITGILYGLLLPSEWKAIFWIFVIVGLGTESIKRGFRYLAWDRQVINFKKDKPVIFISAIVIGAIASFSIWPNNGTAPWYLIAPIAGPGCNFIHKIAMALGRTQFPNFTANLTGNKRKLDRGGPEGIERRKL